MRIGPQIECHGCGLPVLLSFAEVIDGAHRRLACPCCGHVHLWSILAVRGRGDDRRPSLGSSVE
jgi:hypothetical protein